MWDINTRNSRFWATGSHSEFKLLANKKQGSKKEI